MPPAVFVGAAASLLHFGGWRLLLIPTFLLALLGLNLLFRAYYVPALDALIAKAMAKGRKGWANIWDMLTALLDVWCRFGMPWLVTTGLVAYLLPSLDVPLAVVCLIVWVGVSPPAFCHEAKLNRSLRTLLDLNFYLPPLIAVAALFTAIPPWLVIVFAVLGVLLLTALYTWEEWSLWQTRHEEIRKAAHDGTLQSILIPKKFFPRPGVVFEPNFAEDSPISPAIQRELKDFFTVYRVHWFALLVNLALGSFGYCSLYRHFRIWVLASLPLVWLLGRIRMTVFDEVTLGQESTSTFRKFLAWDLQFTTVVGLGVATVFFAYGDLWEMYGLAALFTATLFPTTGFICVGDPSDKIDLLDFAIVISTLAGSLAWAAFCPEWKWTSYILAVPFSLAYVVWRHHHPRTELPTSDPKWVFDSRVKMPAIGTGLLDKKPAKRPRGR